MEKARAVKQANDAKRLGESLKQIKKVDNLLSKTTSSITDACRKIGISVDKYYRIKKNLKS